MAAVHNSNLDLLLPTLLDVPEKFKINDCSFNFFESHEGSCSDSIGSIIKCAFVRGILKKRQPILNIDDILSVLHSESKPSTKDYK